MNYIVEDIGIVVDQMNTGRYWSKEFDNFFRGQSVNYLFGHEQEITNRLTRQQQNADLAEVRYPLIALFMDIEEPVINGVIQYKLNLVIVAKTKSTDNAEQRYEDDKPFKVVLYPLYKAFMQSLSDSGLFMWPSVADLPEHSKFDRPYYGKSKPNANGDQANTANILNDVLDAIQIKNLKINQKLKNC